MKTKKQNSRGNVKYYVVLPTLEIMLSASKNCKIRADYADMEYSNFMKHCKMQTDLRINRSEERRVGKECRCRWAPCD